MLDHVERGYEVVPPLGDAFELGKRRLAHRPAETLFRDRPRFVVQLEAFDLAEFAQHREVVAGAAADLEQPCAGARPCLAPDQGRQHFAPRPVPPMKLVELGHLLVDHPLHQRKTQWRLRVKVTAGVTNSIGTIGQARSRWRWE